MIACTTTAQRGAARTGTRGFPHGVSWYGGAEYALDANATVVPVMRRAPQRALPETRPLRRSDMVRTRSSDRRRAGHRSVVVRADRHGSGGPRRTAEERSWEASRHVRCTPRRNRRISPCLRFPADAETVRRCPAPRRRRTGDTTHVRIAGVIQPTPDAVMWSEPVHRRARSGSSRVRGAWSRAMRSMEQVAGPAAEPGASAMRGCAPTALAPQRER
jgi:hypothetical protein